MKKLLSFQEFLNESINTKYVLKAIIVMGSAGSGKSTIVNPLAETVFKVINQDDQFEKMLLKYLKTKKIDMENMTDDEIAFIANLRAIGKRLSSIKANSFLNSLAPVVFDITGRDYETSKNVKDSLESIGYDVSCIFVDVDLETSLLRNSKRDRRVPDSVLKEIHSEVYANKKRYKKLFGNDFYVVENNKNILDREERFEFAKNITQKIQYKILNKPLQNEIGIKILEYMRANKFKYISDFDSERTKKFKLF